MPEFRPHEQSAIAEHRYESYDCVAESETDLIEDLATSVREMYVEPERLREALERAAIGLEAVADTDVIRQVIDRMTDAAVPVPGTHPIPHLDLARNELGEILACLALPRIYGTVVPARRVREKEIAGQPSRGLDLLGIDPNPVRLVFCEVKVSSEPSSPPGVVGDGDDCLRNQLLAFVTDEKKILRELGWAMKHAPPEHQQTVARALLLWSLGRAEIVVVPVLVRPADTHGPNDYGCFRDSPEHLAPAVIRFCLIRVDGAVEDLAGAVYERARGAA